MRYAIRRFDGTVGIMQVVAGYDVKSEILKLIETEGKHAIIGYRPISDDQLPQDRTFRDAWTDDFDTENVDVHMDRAKEIHKNHWRQLRKPLLEASDIEFMKAFETGDSKIDEIINRKNALRDVTKTDMSHIITPEELKDFIPDVLVT